MIETIRTAWKIPELRKKLLFVALILLIFRLGNNIPVPFIDTASLQSYFNAQGSNILGLLNVMSGGGYGSATMLALSIQPYINASIIMQLLTVAIPALERMQRDGGERGRKRLEQITRYTTLGLGLLQAFGYYMMIRYYGFLSNEDVWAGIVIVLTFAAGSVFVMWLGEQITEYGVGNGISIILFGGILSRLPSAVYYMYTGVSNWVAGSTDEDAVMLHPAFVPVIIIGIVLILVAVVFVSLAERRIPVQYAKRVVGRKMYGGQSTNIPMKVNMSGVMPIIFAQTIASIPATIAAFVPSFANSAFMTVFDTDGVLYCIIYALLIVGFSYFYAMIQFNPVEVANNLKKQGGFIPGYRAGRPTADFLHKVLNRITMFGALYLMVIAILPIITGNIFKISALSIGGTSVLIVVSVALDTQKALEAQMMMRHYKGFLNS
ncbi:MAG: preprotein translocase subunit SecY [Clostridiales bacterium]|nr:preprotein translocase subunit SecY [Clostridiales bacterium]MCD8126000.1 preprotein translocase subunit SecY [Clostridiales bacterium]